MASATRIRRIKFNTGRIIKRNRRATTRALDKVTAEMTAAIQKKINKPSPPVSRPGRPPRRRTGFLHGNTKVTRKGRTWNISTPLYGIFLDGGTRKMAARPFLRITINDRKRFWTKRINDEIRKNSGK